MALAGILRAPLQMVSSVQETRNRMADTGVPLGLGDSTTTQFEHFNTGPGITEIAPYRNGQEHPPIHFYLESLEGFGKFVENAIIPYYQNEHDRLLFLPSYYTFSPFFVCVSENVMIVENQLARLDAFITCYMKFRNLHEAEKSEKNGILEKLRKFLLHTFTRLVIQKEPQTAIRILWESRTIFDKMQSISISNLSNDLVAMGAGLLERDGDKNIGTAVAHFLQQDDSPIAIVEGPTKQKRYQAFLAFHLPIGFSSPHYLPAISCLLDFFLPINKSITDPEFVQNFKQLADIFKSAKGELRTRAEVTLLHPAFLRTLIKQFFWENHGTGFRILKPFDQLNGLETFVSNTYNTDKTVFAAAFYRKYAEKVLKIDVKTMTSSSPIEVKMMNIKKFGLDQWLKVLPNLSIESHAKGPLKEIEEHENLCSLVDMVLETEYLLDHFLEKPYHRSTDIQDDRKVVLARINLIEYAIAGPRLEDRIVSLFNFRVFPKFPLKALVLKDAKERLRIFFQYYVEGEDKQKKVEEELRRENKDGKTRFGVLAALATTGK